MQSRIWLLGGTQESGELARALAAVGIACTVTVTTESARSLYPIAPVLEIRVGALQPDEIPEFVAQQSIVAILDASHPFALEASRLAIATAQAYQLPYLRFERPVTPAHPEAARSSLSFASFADLVVSSLLQDQRVLLTIGYRSLVLFQPWQARSTLFARILPSQVALTAALQAGFTPDRLIALRPPISYALETALCQQWRITCIVTKASGSPGGEAIKRQVAQDLGIQLITIDRPAIDYPAQTSSLPEAVTFCQQVLSLGA